MMSDQHHYSPLAWNAGQEHKTFKFTEKIRHPIKYLKQVIQESTAPDIPIEDIKYNEMIHHKLEQTEVY